MADARGLECNPVYRLGRLSVGDVLPKEFPPFTTVRHDFHRLCDSGMLGIIDEILGMAARLLAGRA